MVLLVLRYCVMVLLLVIVLILSLAGCYGVGDRLWWLIPFLYDVESVHVVGHVQPERNAKHFLRWIVTGKQ